MRTFAPLLRLLVGAFMMGNAPGFAQESDTLHTWDWSMVRTAVGRGECDSFIDRLVWFVSQDPGSVDDLGMPLGLHVGRCHHAAGRTEEALAAWSATIEARTGRGAVEVTLLDAFLTTVFDSRTVSRYAEACEAYLDLVGQSPELPVVARHLSQASLIVPRDVAFLIERVDTTLSRVLVSWWRAQDPLPGSMLNERLAEHLARVGAARSRYADASSAMGFDARGEIYVRLGEPTHRRPITLDRIGGELLRPGVTVNLTDFPEAEFWVYHKVDRAAHYLFAKRRGRYDHAEIQDLIPDVLKYGLSSDPRGQLKSEMLLTTLQEIYRQITLAHQDFASIYAEIDNFAEDRPAESIRSQRQRVNFRRDPGGPTQSATPPHLFAQRTLVEGRAEDSQRRAYRDQVVPRQISTVLEAVDVMPVGVRVARFLGPNGQTYADVAWAPYPNGLRLSDRNIDDLESKGFSQFDRFLVDVFAVSRSADFESNDLEQRRVVFEDIAMKSDTDVPVQTLRIKGSSPMFHVGIQWDQYLVLPNPDSLARPVKGPPVKIGVFRSDSLYALSADPARLEMSDLVPQFVSDPSELLSSRGTRGMAPYPFDEITPESPLALVFEVYHLTLGRDDKTRYAVEYEILRRRDRGIFRGDATDRTAVSTRYTGENRTSREYILVDLSDWAQVGEIMLTVRVKDEVSGQAVERSLPFTVVPAG
jgi:GWxTD domain-containing protein